MTHATIYAFDGLLADTLPLRLHVLRESCVAEGLATPDDTLAALLPGRTFGEVAAELLQGHPDPTLAELIALRAQRAYGALIAHGVPLFPDAEQAVRTEASLGARIVVRADSERRHVEPLLALAGLEHVVSLLRCSDDLPRSADPSLTRSWVAIDTRLAKLGIPETARTAGETSARTASIAAPYVSQVAIGLPP